MPDIQPLNYAPPPPIYRRRVFRRSIYSVVLLGVFASGWWWVPPAWRRVQLLYWQHRCMIFSAPPDKAIYSDSFRSPVTIPEAWSKFYNLLSPPGFESGGTIFLHEMEKPNGDRRLVAIDVCETPNVNFTAARVFVPANLFHNPIETDSEGESFLSRKSLTIFPGAIDAANPSHFTIRALKDGTIESYDGWLQNDDTIIFGQRKNSSSPK